MASRCQKKHIHRIAQATAQAFDLNIEVFIEDGYPFVMNDPQTTKNSQKTLLLNILEKKKVVDLDQRMTAEDFAWYSQLMPASFLSHRHG